MKILLERSGRMFDADDLEMVLDAAERAGIDLPHSCREGICGTCKALLRSGVIDQGPHSEAALTTSEQAQGYFLMCCSLAESDLVIIEPSEGDAASRFER